MKNIVFLVTQLINSGPENVVLNICKSIDRTKFEPIVFSLKGQPISNSIESDFRKLSISIYHFGFSTMQLEFNTRKVAARVEQEFCRVKGDILHVHCYHPNLIASHLKNVQTIATIHQISGEDFILKKGRLLGSYMKWRFDRTLPRIIKNVVISDYMIDYYRSMCNNLLKIPNGVLLEQPNQEEVSNLKKTLGIDNTKPVFLITGALSERKNVVYLLTELKNVNNDFICIVLGDGDKRADCESVICNDSRFRLEGFKKNVADYLAITDIYISASKSEGLPMSVLEALNVGIPCVLSRIPPHMEIQSYLNVPGVECFNLEVGGLRLCIEKNIGQLYDKTAIESKAKLLYSSNAMTNKYEELYSEFDNLDCMV